MKLVNADDDSAGVTFPPPFIYLGSLGAGIAADWKTGLLLFSTSMWSDVLAVALVVAGILISGSANWLFNRVGTDVKPWRASSALVVDGAFRWTRNPMYVGMALICAGLAIVARSGIALVLLPVVLLIVNTQIIPREERYLERRFGEDYLSYKKRVRRWL